MYPILLSNEEKRFITDGIDVNVRCDGRKRCDYRPIELETGLITHANGSARVRLANTDVLVAVKIDVDNPSVETPNSGKIEFFVDCSANATPVFEGRGGEDLAIEISSVFQKAYRSFPLHKLCIVPTKKCWLLYVDILILECGGNLYDAISLAVKAALHNTALPKTTDIHTDGNNVDLQFSDSMADCWHLDLTKAPCLVTLCKIRDYLVTDPTVEEESCSSSSIVVSVTSAGIITAVVKSGDGSFQAATMHQAIPLAAEIGKNLNSSLDTALQQEQILGAKKTSFGFL